MFLLLPLLPPCSMSIAFINKSEKEMLMNPENDDISYLYVYNARTMLDIELLYNHKNIFMEKKGGIL